MWLPVVVMAALFAKDRSDNAQLEAVVDPGQLQIARPIDTQFVHHEYTMSDDPKLILSQMAKHQTESATRFVRERSIAH